MSDKVLSQFKQEEQAEEVKSERKVKVGVIGCGGISYAHFNNYLKMPDVEIVAIADLIPEAMEEKACEFGLPSTVRRYHDHKELIDNEPDIDAVSVCTYNRQHAPCTIYALDHGVNVLLEKPMCVTLEEAVEICRAEKRSGKLLSIGFQPRCDENMKIRKFLDAAMNGEPSPVPSSQIVYNQAILDYIVKSAEAGRELEVVIPEI